MLPRPWSTGNGTGRTCSFQIGFLNEIESVVSVRNETPGEAIEPVGVRLEQRRQSLGLVRRHGRGCLAHTPLIQTLDGPEMLVVVSYLRNDPDQHAFGACSHPCPHRSVGREKK